MLSEWRTSVIVPLYKKGEKKDPSSYRPIALMSHARKAIEAAIASAIRAQYKFHEAQLGFQLGTGTETAIVRWGANLTKRLTHTAVLDLKAAYDTVPRDKLMTRVKRHLDPDLTDMVALSLQPNTIVTKGDRTGYKGMVTRGVAQGSSLSPTCRTSRGGDR